MDSLKSIVSNFLMEAGLGDAEFTKAYHIANRGLRELQIDFPLQDISVTELDIRGDGTAILPKNCLKVLRIALDIDGRLVSLTRNKDLNKNRPLDFIEGDGHRDYEVGVPRGVFNHNMILEPSLGHGSWRNVGEYYISGNTVYLSQNLVHSGNNVVIEYKSLQEDENEDPCVHPFVSEALIAYIRWIYAINKKNQDKWDKQYFEKEWHRLRRNAKSRMKGVMKQEMNQLARQHTKLGLKS